MSPENENKKVLSKYPKIAAYPHLFVLDNTGKLLHSQDTGKLETGDRHDPAKVIPFLKKWAPKKVKRGPMTIWATSPLRQNII